MERKEAIEVIKKNWPDSSFTMLREALKTVIPELKESEDERIRKAIKKALQVRCDGSRIISDEPVTLEEAIAWLEKQGEQKPVNIDYISGIRKELLNIEDNAENIDGLTESQWVAIGAAHRLLGEYIAKEQKPIDKIEPKFKVKYAGSEYNVLEVKDIAGVTFYGIEDESNHIDYVKAENCEKISGYAIKENGSPYPTKPAVFSEQTSAWSEEDETKLKAACTLVKSTNFGNVDGITESTIKWMKGLKYRVQPQLQQEWKQENTGDLTDFENAMMHIGGSFFGQHAGLDPNDTNAIKEQANLLLELVPKQEWSEEDEEALLRLTSFIEDWDKIAKGEMSIRECTLWSSDEHLAERLLNFLKSLKERVQPQDTAYYNPYKEVIESIAEMCKHYDKASHSGLRDFYDNVKVKCKDAKEFDSLFPQNTWKPSKEQMEQLGWIAKQNKDNMIGKELMTLYNDLKKL